MTEQRKDIHQLVAWCDGQIVPWTEASLPVWDLGVVAGAAITEMARTFCHEPFRLHDHLERFLSARQSLGFPEMIDRQELLAAIQQVVSSNSRLIDEHSDLGIVLFATAGSNPTYGMSESDRGTTMVHTFELPFARWRSTFIHGARLRISSTKQIPEDCFPVNLKVRNRLHWWLADQDANRIEPGSRALLLDQNGFVTETSTSSLLIVTAEGIATPKCNVLDSLSNRIVEELALSLGLSFVRRDVHPNELFTASEVLLTSTPSCLLPVSQIDGHAIGDSKRGPVFARLIAAWSQLAGVHLERQILNSAGGRH